MADHDFDPWGLNPGQCDVCGKCDRTRFLLHDCYQSAGIRWLCQRCNDKANNRLHRVRQAGARVVRRFVRKMAKETSRED